VGRVCGLGVRQWAAVRVPSIGGAHEELGLTVGEDTIPSGLRRRMGRLERLAVRCTLGVLSDAPVDELIFCSRYGNVEALSALLRGIAEGQLTSPMAFSGSVHNAAPGFVGQVRQERLSHTAIAAGQQTLTAAFLEAYARIAIDGCRSVVVTFADLPLPEHFHAFEDEVLPGLVLAMRLEPISERAGGPSVSLQPGRRGALALLEKLRQEQAVVALEAAA
jgi:Beta-ketoacyl synthase, N-terminal domain